MMGSRYNISFTWILCVSLLFIQIAKSRATDDENKCEKRSPCLCEFNNNFVLDVSAVGSEGFLNATVESQNITYYFHGCTDAILSVPFSVITNLCNKPYALCILYNNKTLIAPLGNKESISFVNTLDEPKSHDLVFSNTTVTASVQLVCAPELNHDVLFANEANADHTQHRLVLQSHKVCRHAVDTGIGFGTTILILFIVGFTLYFVVGALTLHFLRGAHGLEMIPNLDFWRSLPDLCKDGFLYLINGCKTTQVSTETYDSI